jgi:hypothetical protein
VCYGKKPESKPINYGELRKMFLSRGMTRFTFGEIPCGSKMLPSLPDWGLMAENACHIGGRTVKEAAEIRQANLGLESRCYPVWDFTSSACPFPYSLIIILDGRGKNKIGKKFYYLSITY